jgi:hypothetical protein
MIAPTDEQRDLLPWILGGLCISLGTIAIGVASIGRNAPAGASAPATAAAPASASVLASVPTPAQAAAAALPPVATALVPPTGAASRGLPSGQVWECTVNGQKVFSDKRCGEGSIIRQLGPTNTMDPAPMLPAALPHPWAPSYPPVDYDESPPQPEEASNWSRGAVVIIGNGRREHSHRPHNHERAAPRIH